MVLPLEREGQMSTRTDKCSVIPLEREGQMSTRTDKCSGITFRKGRTNVNKNG